MKTNPEYILRTIAGEAILIPTGSAAMAFNGMINLSEVGAFVWQNLDGCAGLDDLTARIVAEFDVDETTAREDARRFIDSLVENGMAAE